MKPNIQISYKADTVWYELDHLYISMKESLVITKSVVITKENQVHIV